MNTAIVPVNRRRAGSARRVRWTPRSAGSARRLPCTTGSARRAGRRPAGGVCRAPAGGARPAFAIPIFFVLLLTGCAGREKQPRLDTRLGDLEGLTPAAADARAEVVRRDPVAYLHGVANRCRTLDQYTLLMTRYERRGLIPKLHGPEHIRCWYRRRPYSVRFRWVDRNVKYFETAYTEGKFDSKVRFVTRWWTPPLLPPPMVNRVDPQAAVAFGESKRPITDFGLEQMMDRTLAALKEAGDEVLVTYIGLEQPPDGNVAAHHIRLEYSPRREPVPIQDLYIDAARELPVATMLRRPDGEIEGSYTYSEIELKVQLTDEDFLLESERHPPAETQQASGS